MHCGFEIKEIKTFVRLMRQTLEVRRKSVESRFILILVFKNIITVRAKRLFAEFIRKRGFRGELIINHETQMLALNVGMK